MLETICLNDQRVIEFNRLVLLVFSSLDCSLLEEVILNNNINHLIRSKVSLNNFQEHNYFHGILLQNTTINLSYNFFNGGKPN